MGVLRSRDVRTAVAHAGTGSAQQECSSASSEMASHSGTHSDGQRSAFGRPQWVLDVTLRGVWPCGRSWLRHALDRDRAERCVGLASLCASTFSISSNLDGTLFCSALFSRRSPLHWRSVNSSRTSPTRFRNTMFSGDSGSFFSLHFALDYFGGQFEAEFFEKDLVVVGRF